MPTTLKAYGRVVRQLAGESEKYAVDSNSLIDIESESFNFHALWLLMREIEVEREREGFSHIALPFQIPTSLQSLHTFFQRKNYDKVPSAFSNPTPRPYPPPTLRAMWCGLTSKRRLWAKRCGAASFLSPKGSRMRRRPYILTKRYLFDKTRTATLWPTTYNRFSNPNPTLTQPYAWCPRRYTCLRREGCPPGLRVHGPAGPGPEQLRGDGGTGGGGQGGDEESAPGDIEKYTR